MDQDKKNNLKAFSLIELIIVIAITGTISFFTISNFGDKSTSQKVEKDMQKLASILLEAESQAQSGNSNECATNETLHSIEVNKITENKYEVAKICKDSKIPPNLSSPHVVATYNFEFGNRFLTTGGSNIATYLNGGSKSYGSTTRLIHSNNLKSCMCMIFDLNGNFTTNKNCKVTSIGNGTCN